MHEINEEVKKQIEIWQKNPDVYLGNGKGYRKMTVDDLVEQISRLHQKECESIVEELIRQMENFATQLICQGFVDEEYKSFVENRVQAIKQDILKKVRGEK